MKGFWPIYLLIVFMPLYAPVVVALGLIALRRLASRRDTALFAAGFATISGGVAAWFWHLSQRKQQIAVQKDIDFSSAPLFGIISFGALSFAVAFAAYLVLKDSRDRLS